jgi:cell division protein ZapE
MGFRARYAQELKERGFSADPAQAAAVDAFDGLRTRLIERESSLSGARSWFVRAHPREPVRGLYLWGPVGRGKTWLMDLFFQSLPFAKRERVHFHRFMYDVHAQLKDLDAEVAPLEAVAERIAQNVHVLCFDELFVSDIADAMIIGGLLQGLFQRGVALIATSNQPPDRLYESGLQRERFLPAIDLLERHTQVLTVDAGTDYRLRDLASAGTYLLSAAADTRERLRALFRTLAAGDGRRGGTVRIEGRPIAVVRVGGSAIWFEFTALCSAPRSQNDYIEIARAYQSVILTAVPVLDAAHEDEARRFIALIDELYDRNVKLVIAAAAPPAELYRGERLNAEFKRAASRLTEMQSTQYPGREHRP